MRADKIAQALPARAWRRLSAGAGAKGERLYDWVLAPLRRLQITAEEQRFGHYLLVRRSLDEKREHAYYVVYAPRTKATRQTLVGVAGRRWEIETGFEATKGECGLDQDEVRRWQGWYRPSRWRCWLMPCLSPCGCKVKNTWRLGATQCTGDPQATVLAPIAPRSLHRVRIVLVGMAAQAPVPRPAVPLPATRLRTSGLVISTL